MQRIVQLLPPFNSAPTWGTQPVCNVPLRGRSFNWIALRVIGTGPSSAVLDVRNVISDIEVLINDKPVSTFKPKLWQQYLAYQNVNGATPAVDMIWIPFEVLGVPNSELGTADLDSLQIRCTIAADPTSTTFTRIDAWACYFKENAPRAEAFIHRIVTPKMTAAGENVFSNLDFGGIVKLRRMFLMCLPATADLAVTGSLNAYTAITRARIKVGDLPVWDATKELVNYALARSNLYRVPSTQYGHMIPLDLNNDARDYQVIRVNDQPLPVELIVDWDSGTTATQLLIVAEGTNGVVLSPK